MSTTTSHRRQALTLLSSLHQIRDARQAAEVAEVELVADFAETYRASREGSETVLDVVDERFVRLGGEGTPRVSDYASLELGAFLTVSELNARHQLAVALDLRHRLPQTWHRCREGRIPVWVCQKVADLTRELSAQGASWFDDRFVRQLRGLPPGRQLKLAEALVIEADPDAATQREQQAAARRYVSVQGLQDGAAVLHGRLDVLDAHQFDAMTDRIADILAERGDHGFDKERLRARAVGILATPARALALQQAALQPALDDLLSCPPAGGTTEPDLSDELDPDLLAWARALVASQPPEPPPLAPPTDDPWPEPEPPTDPFDVFAATAEASRRGMELGLPTWRWADDACDPDVGHPRHPDPDAGCHHSDPDAHRHQPNHALIHSRRPSPDAGNRHHTDPDAERHHHSDPDAGNRHYFDPDAGNRHHPDPDADPSRHADTLRHADLPRHADSPPPDHLCQCAGHTCGAVTVPPHKLLPAVQLVVHISYETALDLRGVARVEGFGPLSFESLVSQWDEARVTIRPVVDLNQVQGVDRYEIPFGVRDAVLQRDLYEVFPGSQRSSRGLDLDHTVPWHPTQGNRSTGQPQTSPGNLGPLSRRVHRAKTAGLWQVSQPVPGSFAWTSPLGLTYLVTPSGAEQTSCG